MGLQAFASEELSKWFPGVALPAKAQTHAEKGKAACLQLGAGAGPNAGVTPAAAACHRARETGGAAARSPPAGAGTTRAGGAARAASSCKDVPQDPKADSHGPG